MPRKRRQAGFTFGWLVLVFALLAVGFGHFARQPLRGMAWPALRREGQGSPSVAAQLAFLLELNRQHWLMGGGFEGLPRRTDDGRNEVANHDPAPAVAAPASAPASVHAAADSLGRAGKTRPD